MEYHELLSLYIYYCYDILESVRANLETKRDLLVKNTENVLSSPLL